MKIVDNPSWLEIVMSTASEFTKFARPSRLYLVSLVFLWGTFAFFTIGQLLRHPAVVRNHRTEGECAEDGMDADEFRREGRQQ